MYALSEETDLESAVVISYETSLGNTDKLAEPNAYKGEYTEVEDSRSKMNYGGHFDVDNGKLRPSTVVVEFGKMVNVL